MASGAVGIMTACFAWSMLLTTWQFTSPGPKDIGNLDLFPRSVAVGAVHADWPMLVFAALPPMRMETGPRDNEINAETLAEQFALPPRFDPPSLWDRELGFFLCGPPGHPDDRFDLAEVIRDKNKLTVIVESWQPGLPTPREKARRRTHVVGFRPLLDAGEYDLTVVWREFQPSAQSIPFWSLQAVRRATAKVIVYDDPKPPEGARAVAISRGDFQVMAIDKAESARLWAPVPAVEKHCHYAGFAGFTGCLDAGVATGTFDPKAWKESLSLWQNKVALLKDNYAPVAPVRAAKPTDPLYAVIYAPIEVNSDHCHFRSIEWADGGLIIRVQFFHTGKVNGSNTDARSAYVMRLPTPQVQGPVGRRPVTGKLPVQVQWAVLHGRHSHVTESAAFHPLGRKDIFNELSYAVMQETNNQPRPAWIDNGSHAELMILP